MTSAWFACTLILAAAPLIAQEDHGLTPVDIERGGQVYMTNCATCHGPEGDSVPNVNLASNRFRHAVTDQDLIAIVQKGIPGTPMPPGNYTDTQAGGIVAYLHSMAAASKTARTSAMAGDAARGKAIVDGKGECRSCHRIGEEGSFAGPDLSDVGRSRRAADLERSLTEPDAEIRQDNRTVRAVRRDGSKVGGLLLNQDTYSLQLIDSAGKLISLPKSGLREFEIMKTSPMPGYKGRLTDQELADVVSYLVTLKGGSR